MSNKNESQFKRPRKNFTIRTFLVNDAYIALLGITGLRGGYSAWGNTRVEATQNVMNLAGDYVKEL